MSDELKLRGSSASIGVMERRQTCRVCGRPDKFDFNVPDDLWQRVVPEPYVNGVVCLSCFDDFAREAGADYSESITVIYFAGDKATFAFTRLWGLSN